mmetsp:Transcript_29047/g.79728  ORF Transcript_29047/g.79728 Transcript_29047/m.79728 type:complete len:389 (+) Transcript_29047:272-1438(+)
MQTMAPNTREDPKATSSTATTAAALDHHIHHRHHGHNKINSDHHHHHLHHHQLAHEAYTTNPQQAPQVKVSNTMDLSRSTTAAESISTTLANSNGKRKHDDNSSAIDAMERVLNQAEGQGQEVGLKLLFAASLLQSSKSSIPSHAPITTPLVVGDNKSNNNITNDPSASTSLPTNGNHDSNNITSTNAIIPTMPNLAPPTRCLAVQVGTKDDHHADGHASTATTATTATAATWSSNDTAAEHHSSDDNENTVSEFVGEPTDLDVLCGRGGLINKHPGNIVYRRVVDHNKSLYKKVPKRHRILVSQSIVQTIQTHGGRFLQSNNGNGPSPSSAGWTTVSFRRAVQKTSQALREPPQCETTAASVNQGEEGHEQGKKEGQQHTGVPSHGV